MRRLESYGNVRLLGNVMEHAAAPGTENEIQPDGLPDSTRHSEKYSAYIYRILAKFIRFHISRHLLELFSSA